MPKRSSKPRDLNSMAAAIVAQATSDEDVPDPDEGKNPAAVALGRLGGQKGGKARAEKLTPAQRSAAARKAALARWQARQAREEPGSPRQRT
jgi:hypothetical protein